jgi:hypothetical protein
MKERRLEEARYDLTSLKPPASAQEGHNAGREIFSHPTHSDIAGTAYLISLSTQKSFFM